jgi:antagonist of KipI
MSLRVLSPGAFTTVQDQGRAGWASIGVPPSGAFDPFALRAANLLVGNDETAAGLEITLHGPALICEGDVVVAVVGAPFEITVDGRAVPVGVTVSLRAGQSLRVGRTRVGVRAWIAVRGGIDVPLVLGSRSTHAVAGLGGFSGRALVDGDVLSVGVAIAQDERPRRIDEDPRPAPGSPRTVRVVPGPQAEAFTGTAESAFYAGVYAVTPRADRTGIRLEGDPVLADRADIDPEGVVPGAIQVPGDGAPIVLGPDGPATGGYAKIATVITADVPILAQARPGDTLRFVPMVVDEAREAYRARERALHAAIR